MLRLRRFELENYEDVWDALKQLTAVGADIRGTVQFPKYDSALGKWVFNVAYTLRAEGVAANSVGIPQEGYEEGAAR